MLMAGRGPLGRFAARMAAAATPPFYGRCFLARLNKKGFISPRAEIAHGQLEIGPNVFIGDRVTIYRDSLGGPVRIGERSHLYADIVIQTGDGGSLRIGANTHIQPRCHFSAYKAGIRIGDNVQIAPACAFYPYSHGMEAGKPIMGQPLSTKGGIIIENDVWVGYGAVVLEGVTVGTGAVIGAGSVVTRDVPAGAVCAGVPARVLRMRGDFEGEGLRPEGADTGEK